MPPAYNPHPFGEGVTPKLVIEKLVQVPRRNTRGKEASLIPKTYLRDKWEQLKPAQQQKVINAWHSMPKDWREFVINSHLAIPTSDNNGSGGVRISGSKRAADAMTAELAKSQLRQARMKCIIETLKNVDLLGYPESKRRALRAEYQALDDGDASILNAAPPVAATSVSTSSSSSSAVLVPAAPIVQHQQGIAATMSV